MNLKIQILGILTKGIFYVTLGVFSHFPVEKKKKEIWFECVKVKCTL